MKHMTYTDRPLLFFLLIILYLPFCSKAQVSQGFEDIVTSLDCGNSSCYYTDPDTAAERHLLSDNNNVAVAGPGTDSILGFITEFLPSRSGTSGIDGLTDGDAFGVGGSNQLLSELGVTPPEGSQAFLMQDTDGLVVMYFEYVDLNATNAPAMSLQYFLSETTWERSSGQNDRFYVRLEIDNCASATTLTLLDTDGGGPAGNSDGDIDDLQIEGNWNTMGADLSSYIGCRVQLIIEFDANASAETLGLDQILFTEGSRQPIDPGSSSPKLLINPASMEVSLMPAQTTEVAYAVSSDDSSSFAVPAAMSIIDQATGTVADWATTVSAAVQDTTYEVVINSAGLSIGTYSAMLIAGSVEGYEDTGIPITLVVEEYKGPVINRIILVDAGSGTDLMSLSDGQVVDIKELPTLQLSIRAEASETTQSVFMQISGDLDYERIENQAPFALFANRGSVYSGKTFSPGKYSLRIIPYSEDHGKGIMGETLKLDFQLLGSEVHPAFILLNSANDTELFRLHDGSIIDKNVVGDLEFGIKFNPVSEIRGIRFILTGPINHNRTEGSIPPYSLFGDIGQDIQGRRLPTGHYNLTAIPSSGEAVSIHFHVVDDDLLCTAFILVDANTNQDLIEITDGIEINKSVLLTKNLNIRAMTTGQVGSVGFELAGALMQQRTENIAPYALFGDFSGDYIAGALPPGSYNLTATPYSGNRLSGTTGRPKTVNFTVIPDGGGELKLFPNPATTEIQVKMVDTKKEAEVFTIQVHDLQGRLIRSYTSKDISGNDQFKIPTYSMRSGVYNMTVFGSKGTILKKTFVVNK